jgi:alkanesulfonate monooxygenase SsuD/methylene tetrahydromethanopterin reductase-like flavin-dependent oxidoreductase (luciferase family)
MKVAYFNPVPYLGQAPRGAWPVPADGYQAEVAMRSMEEGLEFYQLADEVGFDWVTVAEHHYAPMGLTPNPMVMAGALTQRVRRARIALLGPNLPILNPVRVAEELAMLDTLTGGRVVAGMMRGTSNEYVTYNVNPAESRERFQEALQLIVRAWTEPRPFGWQGRHYEFRTISIWPRPVQRPHPPMFMSASSPEAGDFAARNRISAGFAFTTVPLASKAVAHYRAQAAEHCWEPTAENVLYRTHAHVAETDEQALQELEDAGAVGPPRAYSTSNVNVDEAAAIAGFYGRDLAAQRARLQGHPLQERVELGQLLVGSPETVFEQACRIHGALGNGILEVGFQPLARDKVRRSMELFGGRVLPRLREL